MFVCEKNKKSRKSFATISWRQMVMCSLEDTSSRITETMDAVFTCRRDMRTSMSSKVKSTIIRGMTDALSLLRTSLHVADTGRTTSKKR